MSENDPSRRTDADGLDRPERLGRRDRVALWVAIAIGLAWVALGAFAIDLVLGGDPAAPSATSDPGRGSTPGPTQSLEAGSAEYAFLSTRYGGPARWNPCEPIRYVVNPDLAPPRAMGTLRRAIERVEGPTGLRFRFTGFTNERPGEGRLPSQPARYGPGWAPVLVAWAEAGEARLFTRRGRGLGVTLPSFWPTEDADLQAIVTAQVVLNAGVRHRPGFAQPNAGGLVMMHELGHVVGLGHVDAYGEVMDPSGGGALSWGSGDLEGLGRLGRDAGCFDTPTPP